MDNLDDMKDLVSLPYLGEVDFRGNPGCRLTKYRDHMISASSDALTTLDGVPVPKHQQVAIKGLMKHRRRIMGMGFIEAQMQMQQSGEERMNMSEFENAESIEALPRTAST